MRSVIARFMEIPPIPPILKARYFPNDVTSRSTDGLKGFKRDAASGFAEQRPLVTTKAFERNTGKRSPNPRLLDIQGDERAHGKESEKPMVEPETSISEMEFYVLREPSGARKRSDHGR